MIKLFHDKTSTDKAKEVVHQINSIAWVRHNHPEIFAFHVKNEGLKSIGTAMKDKQEGVVKGVSDILLIGPNGFAAIELKRAIKSDSKVSKEQKEFLEKVSETGGYAAICYGFEMFKMAIEDYLSNSTNC
ncbi:gp20 [Escherichia phage phiEB49]|uniref:Gp20 n=1 Tax=Escherichia phage phiEB49 TaxID=1048207 RepID=F8UBT0_9CAUD|nr:gp20 [Escherichia phage phiEB49]AEI91220.1 gp20 [Escherichia phage phiEB49]